LITLLFFFLFLNLSPDSLTYQNSTNYWKHTRQWNWVYIYFASLDECKGDKAR